MRRAFLAGVLALWACRHGVNVEPRDGAVDHRRVDAERDQRSVDVDLSDTFADLPIDLRVDAGGRCNAKAAPWITVGGGKFSMGSPPREACKMVPGQDLIVETAHPVILTHRFEIMATETTRRMFKATVNYLPAGSGSNVDAPVSDITWHEAAAYCNALNVTTANNCYAKQGSRDACDATATKPCRAGGEVCIKSECVTFIAAQPYRPGRGSIYDCKGYRLPTEAEWEYAYRAKTKTAYYSGPNLVCTGSDGRADLIAWYTSNSNKTLHSVAQKAPNAFCLYDMAGNVSEWVHDSVADWQRDLGTKPATDPHGVVNGKHRIHRGGSYDGEPALLRAAARRQLSPEDHSRDVGFRCARSR